MLVCQRMPEGINSKCHNKVSEILRLFSLFSALHGTCCGRRIQYVLKTSLECDTRSNIQVLQQLLAASKVSSQFWRTEKNNQGFLEAGVGGVVLSSFVSCESYYAISIISLGSSVTPPVKWPFKPDRDVQKKRTPLPGCPNLIPKVLAHRTSQYVSQNE